MNALILNALLAPNALSPTIRESVPSPGEGTEITQIAASLDCFLLNWLFVGISVLFAASWIVHASINHISLFCDSNAIDNLHFLTMCILLYIPIVIRFSFNRNTHSSN